MSSARVQLCAIINAQSFELLEVVSVHSDRRNDITLQERHHSNHSVLLSLSSVSRPHVAPFKDPQMFRERRPEKLSRCRSALSQSKANVVIMPLVLWNPLEMSNQAFESCLLPCSFRSGWEESSLTERQFLRLGWKSSSGQGLLCRNLHHAVVGIARRGRLIVIVLVNSHRSSISPGPGSLGVGVHFLSKWKDAFRAR